MGDDVDYAMAMSKPARSHERFWDRVMKKVNKGKGHMERDSIVALRGTGHTQSLINKTQRKPLSPSKNHNKRYFEGKEAAGGTLDEKDDEEEEEDERPKKRNSFDAMVSKRSSFGVIVQGAVKKEKNRRDTMSAFFSRVITPDKQTSKQTRRRMAPVVEVSDHAMEIAPVCAVVEVTPKVGSIVGMFEAALARHSNEKKAVLHHSSLRELLEQEGVQEDPLFLTTMTSSVDSCPAAIRDWRAERYLTDLASKEPERMEKKLLLEVIEAPSDLIEVPNVCPRFENVGKEARSLVVKIEASDPKHHLEYYHLEAHEVLNQEPGKEQFFEWKRVASNEVRLEIKEGEGTHVFASRSIDALTGEVVSETTTAVFEQNTMPEVIVSGLHPTSLTLRNSTQACSVCALDTSAKSYHCLHNSHDAKGNDLEGKEQCSFALCTDCALAAFLPPPPPPETPPTPTIKQLRAASPPPRRAPSSSVALDVGARRLWLSEDVQFEGNATDILEESTALLEQIANLLKAEQSIRSLVLQGHTNSQCGLECQGLTKCGNDTCAYKFGKTGGAVAFSRRRAEAVRAFLVSRGVDPKRVTVAGLGGSRRVIEDTEDNTVNFWNRRVEIHLADLAPDPPVSSKRCASIDEHAATLADLADQPFGLTRDSLEGYTHADTKKLPITLADLAEEPLSPAAALTTHDEEQADMIKAEIDIDIDVESCRASSITAAEPIFSPRGSLAGDPGVQVYLDDDEDSKNSRDSLPFSVLPFSESPLAPRHLIY